MLRHHVPGVFVSSNTDESKDQANQPASIDREFTAFYRDEYVSVLRLAFVLSGDRQAAEDLTQEAFMAAHRHWGRVSGYERLDAWIRTVVANGARSRFRRAGREVKAMTRLRPSATLTFELPEPTDDVWRAVRGLPRRQATAVALTYLEDRPLRDVAEVLGCGEETARTHLRRAHQSLAKVLGPTRGPGADDELESYGDAAFGDAP